MAMFQGKRLGLYATKVDAAVAYACAVKDQELTAEEGTHSGRTRARGNASKEAVAGSAQEQEGAEEEAKDVDEPEQQEPETAAPVGVRTRGGSGAGVRCGCDKCGEALKLNTWFDARTRITCNGCDKDLIDGDTARSQVEITPRR